MIRKIIFTNYFSEFIHQVVLVQKDLAGEITKSNAADKILKTPYEDYDI